LAEWGLKVERAYVMQLDPQYAVPAADIQYYSPLAFYDRLNPEHRIFGVLMRHVEQIFDGWENIETMPILSSHYGAVVHPFEQINPETGAPELDLETAERGDFGIAVMSTKSRFETGNFEPISSVVVAFGGPDVFLRQFLAMQNANNADYFMNIMNDLSGKEGERLITLTPKSFTVATFQISQEESRLIGVIFAAVLPLAIVITGVVIWLRRRYR
jgi:hypothetical protein